MPLITTTLRPGDIAKMSEEAFEALLTPRGLEMYRARLRSQREATPRPFLTRSDVTYVRASIPPMPLYFKEVL